VPQVIRPRGVWKTPTFLTASLKTRARASCYAMPSRKPPVMTAPHARSARLRKSFLAGKQRTRGEDSSARAEAGRAAVQAAWIEVCNHVSRATELLDHDKPPGL
jgi:hypothetical protein